MLLFILFSLTTGEWVETTQNDFNDGRYECNIYASHRGDGALEFVPRWDCNHDGWIDLLSVHVYGGSKIFWGSEHGYSDNHCKSYSAGIGGGAFADLNVDGYTDFVVTGPLCTHIFWGTTLGPDPTDYTRLQEAEEACFIADFNKDGYLDIAFDYADSKTAGVYWGSQHGYRDENVTHLPVIQAQHNIESADFNKDGWLDLLLPNQFGDHNTIYWGSAEGFSPSNRTEIPFLSSYIHGSSVADLDNDGWLDLVFTGNYNINQSWIYWGPSFKSSEKTTLHTGECYGGSAIADINGDSLLDVVFFRGARSGHAYQTRIQWGDRHRFTKDSYTLVGPESRASGGIIGDFNRDGYHDIFFNSYNEASPVLWGPDFEAEDATYLHGGIDHHSMAREIGNVYSREYKEVYYSSVYDTRMDLHWIETEWEDHCPGDSKVRIAIRTGAHPDDFKREITISAANDPWIETTEGQNISEVLMGCNQRYIQYRATFEYQNPAELPMLSLVRIRYEGEPLEDPLESVGNSNDDVEFSVTQEAGYSQWRISLSTATFQRVDLAIYDIRGSRVRTLLDSDGVSGTFEIIWDGRDDNERLLPRGVYFVRLSQSANVETAKVVLMR